ncbi:MAG: tRNA 5-hydroxyuridine modification protein YegQ, partial [Neisseriaceae bacterium]|nr:tRNA 5-hydroxyuridine modification protein YegQ [Neisseriaceae bacterium]
MNTPELLLPAGGFERMATAFRFGADAVYAGQPRYSLRARNNEFSKLEELKKGIDYAHSLGKKFYLASNIIAHNAKVKTFLDDLKPVAELNPDALIMSDAGLIMLAREHFPDMDIHLSVQANTTNWQAVKFWQNIGISRIILSRELSMDEIAEIRQHCPDIELEVFVHGALCIAYSGRCLLSGYFNHRDPNQGTCTNACRWQYSVNPAEIDDAGNAIATAGNQQRNREADKIWLIEEENRTGEHLPIMEDEHGTYIMNSKDLRAVEQIEQLIKIGVDSLKIEGRTKSVYYVARTAQTYRRA